MCIQILFISLFTDTFYRRNVPALGSLMADFGMNRKRPTAYDGSGALFLGEETEALVREGEGWVSSKLSLLAPEVLGGDGAGEAFGEGDFVA